MTPKRADAARPRAAVAAAVLAIAAVLAVDVAFGHVLAAAFMVGPMLAVLSGSPRTVALLGVVAIVLAIVSGAWNENFGDVDWAVRAVVVALGTGAALLASRARARELEQLARMRLLAELGEMASGALSVEETAERIARVLAPAMADVAAVDVLRGGIPERLAVAGDPPLAAAIAAAVPPPPAPAPVHVHGAEAAGPLLGLNGDAPVPASGALTVPLQTRGGTRGALTLASAGRPLGAADLEFARVAAGRAALALDNAGLSSELTIVERQLAAALANLAEAVTVQDARGRLVYANQAAADLLGYASPAEVVAQAGLAIAQRVDSHHADGRPLLVEDLPGRRVLAGEEPEPLLVRARDPQSREERWRVIKASAVRDDAGKVRYAVNVIEDVTEVKRAELTQRLLAEASHTLAASLDLPETLQRVAEVGVPDLAEWCTVHVPGESGLIELVGVAHSDPAQVERARDIGGRFPARVDDPGGVAEVLRTGQAQLVPDIPPEALEMMSRDPEHLASLRESGIRSAMAVPMRAAGRTVGVMTFVNTVARRPFDEGDLQIALDLGRRAAIAAENARLYAAQAEIARTLQEDLLPPDLPELPGWVTASMYRAAGEGSDVGGDFYDAFEVDDGWVVVVGDVAGRGPSAASLTAMARYTLRTAAMLSGSLSTAISLLNQALYERPRMALCSVCLLQLHAGEREGEVSLLAAGHPDPYVIRDGEARPAAVGGPLLGALSRGDWPVVRIRLRAGDALVLYTDGVIDTQGAAERFGERRLAETLQGSAGAGDAVDRVRSALERFATGRHRDDTAVLALERAGDRRGGAAENRYRARLEPGGGAPRRARAALGEWLDGVLDEDRLGDARLLVSELVTNGVLYGARRAGDALDLDVVIGPSCVRVEVHNPGPPFTPRLEEPVPADARGGRGLLLVRRVASRWGAGRGDRTCVWFEIDR
jgi:PAS domain S-box-containing protein